MARGVRLRAAALAPPIDRTSAAAPGPAWWVLLAALLAVGTLASAGLTAQALDWQPTLAWSQPWRWWTAAWVHWSDGHRWANLAGTALVAVLGWRARCDRLDTLAWFAAWPLTQLGLWWQPALAHYGGLSGVLHAGVVVVAVSLVQRERGARRALGAAMLLSVALKVVLEQPWLGAVQRVPGRDFAVAPGAHVSGAVMGCLCAVITARWRRARQARETG